MPSTQSKTLDIKKEEKMLYAQYNDVTILLPSSSARAASSTTPKSPNSTNCPNYSY